MSVEKVMAKEPDNFPPEALNDDEPRYLRRQKPVEVRRKFGRKTWPVYRRVLVGGAVTLAGVFVLGVAARFFLFSPTVRLASLDQIEVAGNHFVPSATVAAAFAPDLGHSVLRISLEDRRKELAAMPWVAQVWVKRDLPNRIRVELVERTPIAFLRLPNDLALIDASGMILDRPLSAEFHFPVVSGISDSTPADARALRMKMFAEFIKDIEIVRSDAADRVSEADLSDEQDVRATLTGIGNEDGPVLVHFGDSDFGNRYRLLAENIDQWRQSAGRVDSVDLRFARQVVVNPESGTSARAMPADEAVVK